MTFGNGSWTAIGPSECRTRFNRGFILSGQTASTLLGSLTIFARSCGHRVDSQESISCSKQQWRQLLGASRRNEPSYQLKEMVIFRVTRLGPFRRGLSNAPVCIRFRASISLGSPPVFPGSFYRMAGENSSDCSLTIAFRKELQNFLFADDPATIARLRTFKFMREQRLETESAFSRFSVLRRRFGHSSLQERQQVGVNCVRLSRGHSVGKALVGFQCAISQQLCR